MEKERELRFTFYSLIVVALFVVLMVRLGYLQLVHGAELRRLAEGNLIRVQVIPAPRGVIYDRYGRILADTRPAFTVSVLRMGKNIPSEETLLMLADILGMKVQDLKDKIKSSTLPLYEPIRIKRDIPLEMWIRLEEKRYEMPGVIVEIEPIRYYPYQGVAGHVLGYLREIDTAGLRALADQGYRLGDMVGKTGVEALFDRELHGVHGGRQIEVDAKGRLIKTLPQVDAIPGDNIVLTIDVELQRVAEQELRNMMRKLREDPAKPFKNAKAGAIVALDVRTGEILAMVSEPGFNPSVFAGELPLDIWRSLEEDPLKPLTNRAITGEYAPGSTFKMITAIAALETGKTTSSEMFVDPGVYWRIMPKKCWKEGGHGLVNLETAIAVSCNVVFYELGYRTGITAIAKYAQQFGLGSATGINFFPREKTGLVPSAEWKRQAYASKLPGINDARWYDAETLDAAIGQGFHRYTPLQMAVYAAALANGGIRYRPQIVKEVRKPDGTIVSRFPPEEMGRVEVSSATLEIVRKGMLKVTQPGGTAAAVFFGFPIAVAGKTGTVEMDPRLGRDDHGWFIGFAPYDNPQIAVAVIVEEGGGGSRAAAPVARKVLEQYFGLYQPEEATEGRN